MIWLLVSPYPIAGPSSPDKILVDGSGALDLVLTAHDQSETDESGKYSLREKKKVWYISIFRNYFDWSGSLRLGII